MRKLMKITVKNVNPIKIQTQNITHKIKTLINKKITVNKIKILKIIYRMFLINNDQAHKIVNKTE